MKDWKEVARQGLNTLRNRKHSSGTQRPTPVRLNLGPLEDRLAPASVQFSQATSNVQEIAPMSQTVSVSYATYDDTAKAGSDYSATKGTLTFQAGQTLAYLSVSILDDNLAGEPSPEDFRGAPRPGRFSS